MFHVFRPITIGITVSLMFQTFLSSLARSEYLSLFPLTLIFTLWFDQDGKGMWQFLFFFFFMLIITKSVFLTGITWEVGFLKSQRILCFILYDKFLFVHLAFGSLAKFQFPCTISWESPLATQSCIVLYSLWTSFWHLLLM